MRIANPMYDAVFKHLLEDEAAARLVIGAILGEEVERLELVPQETSVRVGVPPKGDPTVGFTVQRIDFAATVRTADGERLRVLIEVQKSHYSEDIARFRRYLGQHYADDRNNYVTLADGEHERSKPLRMLAIYFLARRLPNTDATVLKVARQYLDGITGERLSAREDFVEGLSHDCCVIQVPLLADRRRNDLEKLLSVFDQTLRTDDRHVLDVDEAQIPGTYAPVLRRLQMAAEDRLVADSMALEDEILGEWTRMADAIDERDQTIAEDKRTIAERDQTIAERDHTIAERDQTIAEDKRTIAERDRALSRQQAEIDALRRRLQDD